MHFIHQFLLCWKLTGLGHHKKTPRFWCVEAKFQGESIYDNFGDGDHQRIKQKHRGTTDGLHQPVVSDFIFEEKQLR